MGRFTLILLALIANAGVLKFAIYVTYSTWKRMDWIEKPLFLFTNIVLIYSLVRLSRILYFL